MLPYFSSALTTCIATRAEPSTSFVFVSAEGRLLLITHPTTAREGASCLKVRSCPLRPPGDAPALCTSAPIPKTHARRETAASIADRSCWTRAKTSRPHHVHTARKRAKPDILDRRLHCSSHSDPCREAPPRASPPTHPNRPPPSVKGTALRRRTPIAPPATTALCDCATRTRRLLLTPVPSRGLRP